MTLTARGHMLGEIREAKQTDEIVSSTCYPVGATHRGEVMLRVTCTYVPLGDRLPASRLDVAEITRIFLDALMVRGVIRCRREVVRVLHEDKPGRCAEVVWTVSPWEAPQPTRRASDLIPVGPSSKGVRRGN